MSDLTGPLRGSGAPLEKAVLGALDNLGHALQLRSQGDNRFRATNEPSRFGRVFGGQLLAQAMQAAPQLSATSPSPCTRTSSDRVIRTPR